MEGELARRWGAGEGGGSGGRREVNDFGQEGNRRHCMGKGGGSIPEIHKKKLDHPGEEGETKMGNKV